ncbi:uncharacterized protein PHACADRAFT_206983 [Phanerochaete carnosa HHB-10118-sp]|uniref:G-protein coupled receptors family 1 profile domain-containing protein n=1 Tax=Phanerochaete carnosa (strain HHB-10118-sp) TaxID=650164 RepID=K5V616_PHACS|nr:uncharacterized protein PHACADRAFT_206983 [Phanerochaete carnosa HHB-10118-sp]EKM58146.1 hypothetical protein PHACADRAFT_206983 [Phanerochaete carnosa HHB-10118-sp]
MAVTVPKADFIGTLLETLCYGMYFVFFTRFIRVLYARHLAGRPARYLLAIAIVIFLLITAHLSIQVNRITRAFTDNMDVANGPALYYSKLSKKESAAKASIYVALTLICDILMVYRVYVVYDRKRAIIAVPFVLFLADLALAVWYVWSGSHVSRSRLGMSPLVPINIFYGVTLALNLLCTIMIALKIWTIHRKLPGRAVAGVRIQGIVAIIVESAAIYTCVLVTLIVTSIIHTIGLWIVLDPIPPIIGMVFMNVMVRASRQYHSDTFLSINLSLPTYLESEDGKA